MQISTSSAAISAPQTERARRYKDGSILLSITDDRICKLNGVGALTWIILEENPAGLSIDDLAYKLNDQFEAINAEGELHYEVSREQLRNDTAHFLRNITQLKLLQVKTSSDGNKLYYIKDGVSGTTSNRAGATATAKRVELKLSESTVALSKRETLTAFVGLLAFDLLLRFRGFHSLINRVEHWPIAEPHTTDLMTCRRVRAMVDRAQMYYPKKAMCLQHSAVLTCLLRHRGVPAEMVLAAQEFPPKGHAWTEVDGEVINDAQSVKNSHRVLRRI